MSLPRFFAPAAAAVATIVELPEDEAAHLTRVLRLSPGDVVRVFNGRGGEWRATIEEAQRTRVRVRLVDVVTPAPEPRIPLMLAAAVLKGDKTDEVVRDAVMLGAAAIQPLVSARTETSAAQIARRGRVERWRRIAIASAKQCGRAVVPDVREPQAFAQVVTGAGTNIMLVEPGAGVPASALDGVGAMDTATLLVGPEGGWTDEEVATARAQGVMLLTLGAQTLRADALPIVALTAVRVRLGDL